MSINTPLMRSLKWLAVTMLLLSGGCVMPCLTGVCNSSESLYVSPMARYGAVERKLPESACAPSKFCKPEPYFTFGKYWPFLDEWRTTKAATKCARRNLWKQMWETKSWINAHYRAGFTQSFIDVANGGNGELPPVPPPQYWNAHFRASKGQWRTERWFDGYRAGAAMALVQMQPLRRITASYDWSIEKPQAPFVSPAMSMTSACGMVGGAPAMQMGGFGMPGSQGFAGQSRSYNGYPGQPMIPGYGYAPNQFGQLPPGAAWGAQSPQMSGAPHGPAGAVPNGPGPATGYPGLAPDAARPVGPPAQQFQPAPTGAAVQRSPSPPQGADAAAIPSPAVQPGLPGPAPADGAEAAGQVTPAPGGGAANPIPQRLVPGFSSDANLPRGIPRDDPVWRTRPPQNTGR